MNYKLKVTCIFQGVEYKRRGSLCSDGAACLYAELLTLEERKVEQLEEQAEDLRGKLEKSVEEFAALKEAHMKFVLEVRSIAETKRYWKSALQVLSIIDPLDTKQRTF